MFRDEYTPTDTDAGVLDLHNSLMTRPPWELFHEWWSIRHPGQSVMFEPRRRTLVRLLRIHVWMER